ncbi:MAG TPA: sensor domain-containing diguanylate cyclase [Methylobacterium sp.]|nr:sensor domain-containing diguanylate cyclase [Methylorubrum sp. B1-46]UGB28022.1 sensor domain-containing diguanylate cyclase [Methylorubrum sp. B1-46]HEV2541475.1 sensor domain-containing diguanylate cyclase [Methylobacterium sp.]
MLGATEDDSAEAIRRELTHLREMLEQNSDWIWEVDAQGRYTYASRQCVALLGREPEEVVGRTPFDFMPPDEAERVGRIFAAIAAERRPFAQLLNRNLRKDGSLVVLETSGVPLLGPDGALRGYRGIDRDVTEREAANERLRHIARHDDLTGLPNRMYLREHLAGRLAAGQRPGVISLDLDGFKPVNDRLGHAAGDRVLTEIGRRLGEMAAAHGLFAARPGGDEFVVIVPDGATASSGPPRGTLREILGQAIAAPIVLDAGTVRVSASLGLAHADGPNDTVEALLARADRALYEAKEAAKEAARRAGLSGG